jgi:hypothetical protein
MSNDAQAVRPEWFRGKEEAMIRLVVRLLAPVVLMAAISVAAAEFEPGITLITAEELKAMMDARREMLVANTLSPMEFRDTAIPGSVNLPMEFVEEGRGRMPADKGLLLVFY